MPRPRTITDEEILLAMREGVHKHGPTVSLDVVARELGVTGPALLKRFGSRRALLFAALRPPENPEWIEKLHRGPSDDPLEEQLTRIFAEIVGFFSEVIPNLTALRESGIPVEEVFPKGKPPVRGFQALQGWLARAREKNLICAPELESASFAIMGALQSRCFFAHILGQPINARAQRKYVEELASFFARALTAPVAARQSSRRASST